jgi:hypothetical protein
VGRPQRAATQVEIDEAVAVRLDPEAPGGPFTTIVLACAEPLPSLVLIWIEAGLEWRRSPRGSGAEAWMANARSRFLEAGLGRRGLLITG